MSAEQVRIDWTVDQWQIQGDRAAAVEDAYGIGYIDGLADRYGIDLEQSVTEALALVKEA